MTNPKERLHGRLLNTERNVQDKINGFYNLYNLNRNYLFCGKIVFFNKAEDFAKCELHTQLGAQMHDHSWN